MSRINSIQYKTTPNTNLPARNVKFSSSLGNAAIGVINTIMTPLQQSRFQQMCIEDIFGFAIPRTGMDLSREFIFKNTMDNQRQVNYTAGRERLMMEIMGFAQFWPMMFAPLFAQLDSKKLMGQNFKQLPSINTLEYFKSLQQAGTFQKAFSSNSRLEVFAQTLARNLAVANNKPQAKQQVEALLTQFLKAGTQNANANETAIGIAKLLGQGHLDVLLQGQTHELPTLLSESQHLLNTVAKKSLGQTAFNTTLARFTQGVLKHKAWTIPLALGVGLAYDFISPMLIQDTTRNLDRIDDYPGLKGLRNLKQVRKTPSQYDEDSHKFAYVTKSIRHGNPIPLLISMIPLPLALGFFETKKIALQGFKAAFQNPFAKGFDKRFLKLFEFSKVFPFATSQQISSIYAMLILSRTASARNRIEFRERVVDAFLGWTIWMLATPKLQQVFAQWSDKTGKTLLLKMVNGIQQMKSTTEIERLIKNPVVAKASRQMYTIIGFASMMSTIVLLGLIEPYFSIKLTEWQTRRELAKATPEKRMAPNMI